MADEETGDARRLVSTRAGVLMPERVMRIQRRAAPSPSRGRRADGSADGSRFVVTAG